MFNVQVGVPGFVTFNSLILNLLPETVNSKTSPAVRLCSVDKTISPSDVKEDTTG